MNYNKYKSELFLFGLVCVLLLIVLLTIQFDKEKNLLVVGIARDHQPLTFLDSEGNPSGLDVDLLNEIAERNGWTFKYVAIPFTDFIGSIEAKSVDIYIGGITINNERKKRVSFSSPYLNSGQVIVLSSDFRGISSFENMSDLTYGALKGTVGYEAAKNKFPNSTIVPYSQSYEMVSGISFKDIDAIVIDYHTALGFVEDNSDLFIYDIFLTNEYYGIAVNKENMLLLDNINSELRVLKNEGFIFDLEKKWVSQN